jgi:hypothetical protein
MSFFDDEIVGKDLSEKTLSSASITNKLSSQLSKIIKIKKASNWNKHIKDLISDFGEEDVIKVMEWFSKAYQKTYHRKIFSAGGFRAFFPDLLKSMENDPGQIEFTELTLKIAKAAQKQFNWPAGTDRELPLVIQKSYDNYVSFMKRFKELGKQLEDDSDSRDRLFRLHRYIGTRLSAPRAFTEYWIEYIGEKLQNWEGWNGSLTQYIWTPNHELFLAEARTWVFDYCNSSKPFDDLWQRL